MSNQNEGIKFPLSKKLRDEFIDKYDKIFFKKPPHNIKDEKLVEMVNSNLEKLNATNAGTQPKSSPEGTQNEGGEEEQGNSGEGNGTESNGNENNESGNLEGQNGNSEDNLPSSDSGSQEDEEAKAKAQAQKEREYQFDMYKQLHGEEADGELSTDEVAAANVSKLNYNTAMKVYFDLFGKKPLPEMTTDQILSSIAVEQKRQEEAKAQAAAEESTPEDNLKHNPETEMIIVNKKDKNDKRVINKGTFQFLKDGYDAVIVEPKELKNFKK